MTTHSCQICGRQQPIHRSLCPECSELVDQPRTTGQYSSWRTWMITLLLVIGGMVTYYLLGKYHGRDIFWSWLVGRSL